MLLGAQTTSMLAPEDPETAVVVAGWSRGAAHVPVASRGPLDGRGFVGRILRSGQPVRVDGFDDVDGSSPRRRALGLRSALVGPSSSAAGLGALAASSAERVPRQGRIAGVARAAASASAATST
jgi:hypothetical protein